MIVRDLLCITEKPERAGELLMQMAIGSEYNKAGFTYYSNRVVAPGRRAFEKSEISKEANSKNLSKLLWEKTEYLIANFRNFI